jgi:hypothetical protein
MSTKQDTKAKLMAAKILGISGLNENTPIDEIDKAINEKLGKSDSGDDNLDKRILDSHVATITKHGEEAVAKASGPVVADLMNIPNLSPTGQWEGKRAHLKRTKTGHNDMQGAMFNWNGWPCIIPIDKWVDVAWPIYEIIQKCRGMEMEIRQEEDPRNKGRVKNIKDISYFDKYPFTCIGVTPGTEDLPESPWEYTLDMYVKDFPGYTVRKWRQLCILWEISDDQANISAGMSPEKEVDVRRNSIHYHLNLPLAQSEEKEDGATLEVREQIRNEKRSDIGMEAIAA